MNLTVRLGPVPPVWIPGNLSENLIIYLLLPAGLVGNQRIPVCPFLHGLPGGPLVLHPGSAGGESGPTGSGVTASATI